MVNISLVASIFLLLLVPIAYSESIGVTFDVVGLDINISQPESMNYILIAGENNTFSFSTSSSIDSTFNISAYLDNVQIYSNTSYANNSEITFNHYAGYGSHNFTVYASDSLNVQGQSVIFTNIRPSGMWFSPIILLLMGAGGLMFATKLFVGSPKNPKEFVEIAFSVVIVISLLTAGIVIIAGLI